MRPARSSDLAGIVKVKEQTWPAEAVRGDCVESVLGSSAHTTILAELGGKIAGFVSNFITLGEAGPRWEIDLLAVVQSFRGRGVGNMLVAESCRRAQQQSIGCCRALIQVGNTASQRCFFRNGFRQEECAYRLFVSSSPHPEPVNPSQGCNLLHVKTMNYCGIWIESAQTPADLLAGRSCLGDWETEIAGILIPSGDANTCQSALQSGYEAAGDYHWWWMEKERGS